jgi:hypothetical protein
MNVPGVLPRAAGAAAPGEDEAAAAMLAALDPFPDMTEAEVLALLDAYEKKGMPMGPIPEDIQVRRLPATRAAAAGAHVHMQAPHAAASPRAA